MSTSGLIPQAFWFRLALPCRRVDGVPRAAENGPLLDLPESCLVVPTVELEGREPWSAVRVAWNPGGLAIQVDVTGKQQLKLVVLAAWGSYSYAHADWAGARLR